MPPSENDKPDKKVLITYGAEVRRLRKDSGLTQTTLAKRVKSSKTGISDVERGKVAPSPQLRSDLDKELAPGKLTHLWKELTGSGGGEVWKFEIAGMIDSAAAVYEYEIMVFPAYLQTREYAAALIKNAAPWLKASEVEEEADKRARRAEKIAVAETPRIWAVLDESILTRRYGSPAIIRDQLAYVVELAERGRISVQLVPGAEPRHPGNSGAFKLITTDYVPEVLVAESIREGQVITNAMEVSNYRMAFTALQGVANSPEQSLTQLRDEVKRLEQ
ncbi:helix-turn-helix transcriptional regulator [Nocardiopsis exhalans]|uniref:Helix-turn-helix transcriptional regulator n=1 Tax=Nocardiopsis exhalans TaxID=163604 RepID=A0ABY5D8P9_9ACTN|nr:helix-turn-helix transcriptional regulator [Nocardiopsis exhalans]USY20714.1 helix-turn-helix transcriptional regulator [Nocardiopsis exhalans]